MAKVLDEIEVLMAIPKKVKHEWEAAGFSSTIAEQAAFVQWVSMLMNRG